MTTRAKFWKNGIMMTLVGLLLRTVALGFSAFISRKVGAEGIGLYTLITTVYSFLLTFATAGISLTVTRLVAEVIGKSEEEKIGKTVGGAVVYSLIFSGAATIILASLSGVISRYVIADSRSLLPLGILSISLIPASLSGVFSGYFVGVRRVLPNAIIQVLGQLLRVGATILLLLSMVNEGVESAVTALCIGVTVSEVVVFVISFVAFSLDRIIYYRRKRGEGGISFLPTFKMALPLGVSAYIHSALLSVEHAVIPMRLEARGELREEALASFGRMHGMALPVVTYPMSPLSSFSGLLVPEFAESDARGDGERVSRIAGQALSLTLIYAACASVILFLFSEEIGYIIYNSFDAGVFIAVLAPVIPLMYLDHVTDSILKGMGEQVYSMWVNIADSALSLVLVFFFVKPLGIIGYALVIIVMELFNFTLSYLRLERRIRIKIDLIHSLIIPLLSGVLASVLVRVLFVRLGTGASIPDLVGQMVFTLCAFILVFILLTGLYRLMRGRSQAPSSR